MRGFTLIELIVVVVVLGVLATIAIVGYGTITKDAEENVAQANLAAFTKAIMTHHTNEGAPELTRAMTLDALANSSPGVVDGGVGAEGSWKLFGKDHQVSSPNEFAIGFAATPGGEVNNDGGRFAVLTAYSGEKTYAQSINYSGVPTWGNVDSENAAGSTPAELIESIPVPESEELTLTYGATTGVDGTKGSSFLPTVSGGSGDYSYRYEVEAGSLPEGFTFDEVTGEVGVLGVDPVVQVAANSKDGGGDDFTLAVTKSGKLYGWGDNYKGQLGYGTRDRGHAEPVLVESFTDKRVKSIAVGNEHTIAVTDDGEVYTWGSNGKGQLGDGTTTNRDLPVLVGGVLEGETVSHVAAGRDFTLAVTEDGKVFAWGQSFGRGNGNSPVNTTVPSLTEQLEDKHVVQVAATGDGTHVVALTREGDVYTWGSNAFGQLGNGQTNPAEYFPVFVDALHDKSVKYVAAGDKHTIAVTENGEMFTWGNNNSGQLGDGTTDSRSLPVRVEGLPDGAKVTQAAAGYNYTSAVTEGGEVYSWGLNAKGQLGDGTTDNRSLPVRVEGLLADKKAIQISNGGRHTAVVATDGEVYSWGQNYYGNLGDGTTTPAQEPVQVHNFDSAHWDFTLEITVEDNTDERATSKSVTFSTTP